MTHSIKRCILHLFLKSSELHIKCKIWSHSLISDSNSVQVLPDPVVVLLLGGRRWMNTFSVQTTLINSYLKHLTIWDKIQEDLVQVWCEMINPVANDPLSNELTVALPIAQFKNIVFCKKLYFLNLSPIWSLYVQWAGLLVVVKLHVLVQSLKIVIVKRRSPIVQMSTEVNSYLDLLFGQVKACEVGDLPQHSLLILL